MARTSEGAYRTLYLGYLRRSWLPLWKMSRYNFGLGRPRMLLDDESSSVPNHRLVAQRNESMPPIMSTLSAAC
jgi:hypothetical protein